MSTYPYFNVYNPQPSVDRINDQINQLENMKKQLQQPMPQPTNLTQNFQIAPTNHDVIKYANSMDDVQKDIVIGDTPYFSKDMSVVWIKSVGGNIRTYELTEIIPKDEKDLTIEYLQSQIEELKGQINHEQYVTSDVAEYVEEIPRNDDEPIGATIKKNKPTGIPRLPKSKTK